MLIGQSQTTRYICKRCNVKEASFYTKSRDQNWYLIVQTNKRRTIFNFWSVIVQCSTVFSSSGNIDEWFLFGENVFSILTPLFLQLIFAQKTNRHKIRILKSFQKTYSVWLAGHLILCMLRIQKFDVCTFCSSFCSFLFFFHAKLFSVSTNH